MQTKYVVCPVCHAKTEVANPTNEPSILVTCSNPECQAKMRVTFDTGETQLASPKSKKNALGSLMCLHQEYPLRLGTNTVGRKSPTSDADIQIDVNDHTMSRVHLTLEAVQLQNGRIKVIAGDARPKAQAREKPLIYEDEPLFYEDRVVLANGDVMVLGKTKVKYIQE